MKIFFVGTGTDVAGEVVEVGSGVKNFKAGDKVVAMLNFAVKYSFLLLKKKKKFTLAPGPQIITVFANNVNLLTSVCFTSDIYTCNSFEYIC
jgi:threonine dehydrogenase-like Zn-dependent dehydrogenase